MLLDTRAQRLFQCPLRIRRPGIVGVVRIEFFFNHARGGTHCHFGEDRGA